MSSLFGNKEKKIVEHKTESNQQGVHAKYAYILDAIDKIYHTEIEKLSPRDKDYAVQVRNVQRKLGIAKKEMVKVIQDLFGENSITLFDENGKFIGRNKNT